MRKYILTFVATVISIASFAQHGGSPMGGESQLSEEFLHSLNINEKQENELQTAFINYQKKVSKLHESTNNEKLDRTAIQKKITVLKKQHLEEVKSLLSNDVFKQYADYTLMNRRKQKQYLLEMKLHLTIEQKKQYDAINASVNQITSKLRKEYQGDRAAMFKALEPVNNKKKQMMSKVLSEEQMKIYVESTIRKRRH